MHGAHVTKMHAIATRVASSVVCIHVCLCVRHTSDLCKNDWVSCDAIYKARRGSKGVHIGATRRIWWIHLCSHSDAAVATNLFCLVYTFSLMSCHCLIFEGPPVKKCFSVVLKSCFYPSWKVDHSKSNWLTLLLYCIAIGSRVGVKAAAVSYKMVRPLGDFLYLEICALNSLLWCDAVVGWQEVHVLLLPAKIASCIPSGSFLYGRLNRIMGQLANLSLPGNYHCSFCLLAVFSEKLGFSQFPFGYFSPTCTGRETSGDYCLPHFQVEGQKWFVCFWWMFALVVLDCFSTRPGDRLARMSPKWPGRWDLKSNLSLIISGKGL